MITAETQTTFTGSPGDVRATPGEAHAPVMGLSQAEVEARRRQGLGNAVPLQTTRSYWQILRENVFTFINTSLFVLGIALVFLGRPADSLVSVGVVVVNTLVSALQEVRAKRKLDRIALLTRPTATVIREGREETVDPSAVVLGDVLVLRPGDQAVADGRVIRGRADMDESLLTGESEAASKGTGETVYSGSFCVQGIALFEAEKVGAASVASQITATARAFRRVATPLQFYVSLVVRVLLLVVIFIEMLLVGVTVIYNAPVVTSVRNSVVVVGLVPNGLFLSIAVAYALGAVRIAGQAILIQQSNAIESLSNVDVLCLDKTGTLTANRIRLHALHPIGVSEDELRRLLGDFSHSAGPSGNRTAAALAEACPGAALRVADEAPFSSERKWSGLAFADPGLVGTFVLGAPEILRPRVAIGGERSLQAARSEAGQPGWAGDARSGAVEAQEWGDPARVDAALEAEGAGWEDVAEAWAGRGLRVVLFACAPSLPGNDELAPPAAPLHGPDAEPRLPARLIPLGLAAFTDELRPEAPETLAAFARAGIEIKIISGDNPHTVAALARQAGLGPDLRTISGQKLAQLDPQQFAAAAESTTVFGRITPQQKAALVAALKARGRYVAMTGDGINDIMALKGAHLGIAMETGSQAARAVADIVLVEDSFAALPAAFAEGQRIRNGMEDVLKLFLTRLLTVTVLVGAVGFVGGFAYTPRQVTIVGFITVGIPTVVLAARAGTGIAGNRSRLLSLFHFVLPAGLSLAMTSLTAYLGVLYVSSRSFLAAVPGLTADAALDLAAPAAQSALAFSLVLCGLALVPFVVPPFHRWQRGGVPARRRAAEQPDGASGAAGPGPALPPPLPGVEALGPVFMAEELEDGRGNEADWRPSAIALALLVLYLVVIFTPPVAAFFELVSLTPVEYLLIAAQSVLWAVLMRWAWRSQVLERFVFGEIRV